MGQMNVVVGMSSMVSKKNSFEKWTQGLDMYQPVKKVSLTYRDEKEFKKVVKKDVRAKIVALLNKQKGEQYEESLIQTIYLDDTYTVEVLRGQKGVVAINDIPANTPVAIYEGKYCSKAGDYTVNLVSDRAVVGDPRWEGYVEHVHYYLDPTTENPCKYINDFRGHPDVSPNCSFITVMTDTGYCMAVILTTRDIKKDENLLVDYGEGYWKNKKA